MLVWTHKSTWRFAGMLFLSMYMNVSWSQEPVSGLAQMQTKVALIQHEEMLFSPRKSLDREIKSIASIPSVLDEDNSNHDVENILLNQELSTETRDGDLLKANSVSKKELVEEDVVKTQEFIPVNVRKHRKISARGVKMVRRMLWMSLFYSGSK